MVARICSGTRSGKHLVRMSNISFFEAPLSREIVFTIVAITPTFFRMATGRRAAPLVDFLATDFFAFDLVAIFAIPLCGHSRDIALFHILTSGCIYVQMKSEVRR